MKCATKWVNLLQPAPKGRIDDEKNVLILLHLFGKPFDVVLTIVDECRLRRHLEYRTTLGVESVSLVVLRPQLVG